MANQQSYRVLREHEGDKAYAVGDTRKAEPGVVQHLVDLGVLEQMTPAKKAAAKPSNKAAPKPANKAAK